MLMRIDLENAQKQEGKQSLVEIWTKNRHKSVQILNI